MATPPVVPQEKKKGLSPLAWVGIGCLAILVIGGVVATVLGIFVVGKVREAAEDPIAATARLLAAANPEIELVEANKEAQTVTFRNVKTGEELTFNYDDIEQGRVSLSSGGDTAEFEVSSGDGDSGQLTMRSGGETATFSAGGEANVPDWVPIFPGVTPTGQFASESSGVRSGAFSFEADSRLDEVFDFYDSELKRLGLEVKSRTTTNDGGLLVATSSDESRSVNLMASTKGGSVEVVVNFTEKR